MPERTTAEAQLERILYALPAAAREGGARLSELASALGCSVDRLVADINEVAQRDGYRRASDGDDFGIYIEADRVEVRTTYHFDRPVRLTAREATALGLGLRVLAHEDDERREELLRLASVLEQSLVVPEYPVNPGGTAHLQTPTSPVFRLAVDEFVVDHGAHEDDIFGTVVDAVRESRVLEVEYLRPGHAPAARAIEPCRLVHARGNWYCLARARESDDIRAYRLDRMLGARITDEFFELPADFDVSAYVQAGGFVFGAGATEAATVRYSPRIARWIVERMACEPAGDGSVTLTHAVADPDWLVRHVLQYGSEAELLGPHQLRELARTAAERVVAGAA